MGVTVVVTGQGYVFSLSYQGNLASYEESHF